MKLIFVLRALFTVCLLAIFCIGAPALASDFGSHKAAANGYRKNLPRLRSDQASIGAPFYANEPSALNAASKQSDNSSISNNIAQQVVKPIEMPDVSDASDDSFFTDVLSNRLSRKASGERRNPYTIIAAAMRTDSLPRHLFVPPRFVEQLLRQLTQLRTSLQERPVRFIEVMKATLSNVLDQVSTKAHRTAEQLRQP